MRKVSMKVPDKFVDPNLFIDNPEWVFKNPEMLKVKRPNPGDCCIFEEKGFKDERTLIVKIYGWYTTVFINKDRPQYLITLRYQEEFELFRMIMNNEKSIFEIISGTS